MQAPDDFDPPIGVAETLAPGLQRLVAPNPSPMTYRGTNTYLLGQTEIAVIDPGPANDAHLAAILASVPAGGQITHIIVTHAHVDHSPLSRALSEKTGAQIYAFGPAEAGRSTVMSELAAQGLVGGGEGIDTAFVPDVALADGDTLESVDWALEVLHTPGHIGNHICLAWGYTCFTADHVMGWASSLVSPPDGDLTDFMASCARLAERQWSTFYPGHGDVVSAPNPRLNWLVTHRKGREAQILAVLNAQPGTARTLAEHIYSDTPNALIAAAERNVLAHLIDLHQRGEVETQTLGATAVFERVK